MGIRIIGTGRYLPERVLTNADMEKLVDTSDEWIVSRTGIRFRHIASREETTSDMAAAAAKNALDFAGVSADTVDLIIISTVTPDMLFPNTASIVQRKIGANACTCFDISAACSGLLYGLNTAYGMMASPLPYRRALVIGAEKLSSIVDWHDRSTCVLFGDAASAVLLENDGNPETPDFYVDGLVSADGNFAELLKLPAGGSRAPASHETVDQRMHYLRMGGPKTFQLAVRAMSEACQKVLEHSGVSAEQLRWAVPHQANQRIIAAVAQRLKIPERVYLNVDRYGNTSSASIGICLDELNRAGKVQRDDLILTASFGAGLTWASLLIRW